jgi:hypothetical protein
MRLEPISKDLALRPTNSPDPGAPFETVFWHCVKRLAPTDFELLDNAKLEKQLQANILPREENVTALRDQLDEKYFDAEDRGQLELSGRYFALARLMAALDFYSGSSSTADLADAVYEAIMSTPNPKETAQKIDIA